MRIAPSNRWRVPALAAALALAACSGDPEPVAAKRAAAGGALASVVVESAMVPAETAFDGVIEAINQSTVAAQTSGRVVELPYDVGDYVEKDAVVVRFTGTEQRARAGGAEAALSEANARLKEAELAHQRTTEIYARKLVAKAQLDQSLANLDSAKARAQAARAAVEEAREGLGYTVIRAPYAGIVVERHVQVGETVAPGTPLMTGLSLEHLRVAVDIPQQRIGPLRRHREARVILPDGASVDAEELRIPPGADPATHAFRVLVTLPPGEHRVHPGTLVKVAFVSGEAERLLVPASALVRRGEVTAVHVVAPDGRVALRYVRIGNPAPDGRIPVLSGLASGERVALDPVAAAAAYRAQSQDAGAEGA